MIIPSADSYFMSGITIGLDQGLFEVVGTWANRFLAYRDQGFPAESRALLYGIKPYKSSLDAFSRALVFHCEGLWLDLWGDPERARSRFERSIMLYRESQNVSLLSGVLNDLGVLCYRHSEWDQAKSYYREGLRLLDDCVVRPRYEPMLHNNLGMLLYREGDMHAGMGHLEQAASLYERAGDRHNAARVWVNFGQVLERQGQSDQALTILEQALPILDQAVDTRILVELYNSLGVLYRYRGEWSPAHHYFQKSFAVARTIGDIGGQAQAFSNLGVVAQGQGQYLEARDHYLNALALYQDAADRQGVAVVEGNLGHLASLKDDHPSALDHYRTSLAGYEAVGDQEGVLKACLNIAVALRDLKDFDAAELWFQDVLDRSLHYTNLRIRDRILAAMGYFRTLQQRWDEAAYYLQEALTLQQQRGDHFAQVETYFKLGVLSFNRGDYASVNRVTEPGWHLAQTYDYGVWLIRLAFLCADAAKWQRSPALFRYYTVAWYYAKCYDQPNVAHEAETHIFDYLQKVDTTGDPKAIEELHDWLVEIWNEEPWCNWITPLRHRLATWRALRT